MSSEPDLDAPGKPTIIVIDGVARESAQTKFDNCVALMGEIEDRVPTDDELARWELTKAEYAHFLMDLHVDDADLRDRMAATRASQERMTGQNLDLPELEKDRLGLSHQKQEPEDPEAR